MAQLKTFIEMGSIKLKKGVEYCPLAIQSFAPDANIVLLKEGNIQFREERDRNGVGNGKFSSTEIRGIKVTIKDNTLDYPTADSGTWTDPDGDSHNLSDYQNTATLWVVGDERKMEAVTRITPQEDGGVIVYGKEIV